MSSYSKRKVLLFAAVLICLGGRFAYSAGGEVNESVKPWYENLGSGGKNDPNFGGGLGEDTGLGRLLFSAGIVIVLGVSALYLSKKVLPRFTQSSGKRIQVIETVYLGPRKAVHLVRVGEQTVLLGSTNENISKLADVNGERFDLKLAEQLENSKDGHVS